MIALTECQLKQSFISLLIVFKLRTMQKEKENLVTKNRRHCKKEDFWGRWAVSMTPGSQKYFAPSDIKPAVWTGSILLLICTPPLSAYCYTNPTRSPPPCKVLPDALLSQKSIQQPAAACCPIHGNNWLTANTPALGRADGSAEEARKDRFIRAARGY